MLLQELVNTTPIKWHSHQKATFEVDGKTYTASWYAGMRSEWGLEFGFIDQDRAMHATGGGNEMKVFSAVQEILQKYLDQKGRKFYFTAKLEEPTRIKLYDRLVNRLNLDGWEMKRYKSSMFVNYIFEKS